MKPVVVFDVNILIAAYLSPYGPPARCLDLVYQGRVVSATSEHILRTLGSKLRDKLGADEATATEAVEVIRHSSRIVSFQPFDEPVTADPEDDCILATAIAGQAIYLVTGDRRHLLPLGRYRGVWIVAATEFLARADLKFV